jgi:hypothetical protein
MRVPRPESIISNIRRMIATRSLQKKLFSSDYFINFHFLKERSQHEKRWCEKITALWWCECLTAVLCRDIFLETYDNNDFFYLRERKWNLTVVECFYVSLLHRDAKHKTFSLMFFRDCSTINFFMFPY